MNNGFVKINARGAVYFRSSGIAAPHGFSTRAGGVSMPAHLATMNLGRNLGDDPCAVDENYRRILSALGLKPGSVVFTDQIHSDIVRTVTASDIGRVFRCDALVTDRPGVTACVRTADCVPILFFDECGVVGAAHAGWRGTIAGIAANTVEAMVALGAGKSRIHAAIGAAIRACCYQVGEDFFTAVSDARGKEFTCEFVTAERENPGKYRADIVGMNVRGLIECGLEPQNIDVCGECTCCSPDVFFSHRASGGRRGVMGAFIGLA